MTKIKPSRLLAVALTVAVAISGIALSAYWLQNKPRAQRAAPKVLDPLVETAAPQPRNHTAAVSAMGTVVPAQSVELGARISGEIVEVNPRLVPGARLQKGELVARIDPADYEIALRQKEADLVEARYALALEEGQQAIARREYELLGDALEPAERSLVLREPHLAAAKAKVAAAEAALTQARLNLERTRIVAPFNAVVRSRSVAPGMQVGSGTAVATLVDSDRYWIEALVDVPGLERIRKGTSVALAPTAAGVSYPEGRVIGIMSDVASQGRMARIVVQIDAPLDRKGTAVPLLGDLVALSVAGGTLENVLPVERAWLREGSVLWLLGPKQTLHILNVTPVWAERDRIYINAGAIEPGYRIITTSLSGPVEGMHLREAGGH